MKNSYLGDINYQGVGDTGTELESLKVFILLRDEFKHIYMHTVSELTGYLLRIFA